MGGSVPRCFSMLVAQVAKFMPCTGAVMVFILCPLMPLSCTAALPHRCATAQRATLRITQPLTTIVETDPDGPRTSGLPRPTSFDTLWRGDHAGRPHQPGHRTQLGGGIGILADGSAVPAQAGEPDQSGRRLAWAYALRTRFPSETRRAIQGPEPQGCGSGTWCTSTPALRPASQHTMLLLWRGIVSGYFVATVIGSRMPSW